MSAPRGRPPRPMYPAPAPPADPELARAFEDLADGAMSYSQAAEWCGDVSPEHVERAARAGEIETYHDGRRVLCVARSVRLWQARKLAAERARAGQ